MEFQQNTPPIITEVLESKYSFFKNTSVASLIFSACISFIFYILFQPTFIFSWLQKNTVFEGGKEIGSLVNYMLGILFCFTFLSISVFLFRKVKWWIALICTAPLFVMSWICIMETDSFSLPSLLIKNIYSIIQPYYYYYLIFSPIILQSLLISFAFIALIQVAFDFLIGKYKVVSLSIAMIMVIGASLLIAYQVKKAEELQFVSTDSLARIDVEEVNNLFLKFNDSFIGVKSSDIEKSIKEFETQANSLKAYCDSQSSLIKEECNQLYTSAISEKLSQLRYSASIVTLQEKDIINSTDVIVGQGEIVKPCSKVLYTEKRVDKVDWIIDENQINFVNLCGQIDNDAFEKLYGDMRIKYMNKTVTRALLGFNAPSAPALIGMKVGGQKDVTYKNYYDDDNRQLEKFDPANVKLTVLEVINLK